MATTFAFAQIKSDVCLVQVPLAASALMATDITVFRHEFLTIFRFSHRTAVHPADLRLLCTIDAQCAVHDEDKGTVCLARDVLGQVQRMFMMGARRTRRAVVVASR